MATKYGCVYVNCCQDDIATVRRQRGDCVGALSATVGRIRMGARQRRARPAGRAACGSRLGVP
jgi:hypothetical protein